MAFKHYQQQMEKHIRRFRRDLTTDQAEWIVQANSPFELQPEQTSDKQDKFKKGMLLVHGLLDCPFVMRELGEFYQREGFLVQAILLDGHGTIPEQLKEVEYPQWIDNINQGISNLRQTAEEIYITGFSTGGLLAIYHALTNKKISAIITLCPAFKMQPILALGTRVLSWTEKIIERDYWNTDNLDPDPTKYISFPLNAPYQLAKLGEQTEIVSKDHALPTPLCMIASDSDETVSGKACVEFFTHQKNPANKMLYYSNQTAQTVESRIMLKPSADKAANILDYSHIAIPISSRSQHYGANGDYQQPVFYRNKNDPQIYHGALTRHNLKNYNMQRLQYNPQFDGMCDFIKNFLAML